MQVNRQQACGIFGLTRAEFDRLLPLGLPARKKSSSRGQDWAIDTCEMHQWLAERKAAKVRPRAGSAKPDFSTAPPGWEAFKAAEKVEDLAEAVSIVNVLYVIYALPRLVANLGAEVGVPVDQSWRLAAGLVLAVLELCRSTLDYWPQGDEDVPLLETAFMSVNWPHMAVKGGTPDWRPPIYGMGWPEVTPEEFAACVAHGEAMERDAAARADA